MRSQSEHTIVAEPLPVQQKTSPSTIPAMYVKQMPGNCPSGGSHDFEEKPAMCGLMWCYGARVQCRKCQIVEA